MKTLKLKAFHKTRKEIYHVSFINFDRNTITLVGEKTANGEWFALESLKNVVIMMCTNLKDNEGKDIYEGNVVEYKDGEYSFTGVVTYSPFGWFVKTEDDNISFEHFADESKGVANCTVVGSYVEEWKRGGGMKTIALSDFELNLIHGLLADEEMRLKKAYKILSDHEDIFENTKKYIEEVNKLRKKFTEIDDTEDYFEVADRIEDYNLDNK